MTSSIRTFAHSSHIIVNSSTSPLSSHCFFIISQRGVLGIINKENTKCHIRHTRGGRMALTS
jgi:hypothetical protein